MSDSSKVNTKSTYEEWRPVPFPMFSHYEVSSLGRIRRTTASVRWPAGHILSGTTLPTGYRQVLLSGATRSDQHTYHIARLVTEAFLGPRPAGRQRNHKNGDKSDNSVENLEYISPSQNVRHALALGLKTLPDNRGSRNGSAKLSEEDIPEILRLLQDPDASRSTIAKTYGVKNSAIGAIERGTAWKHIPR